MIRNLVFFLLILSIAGLRAESPEGTRLACLRALDPELEAYYQALPEWEHDARRYPRKYYLYLDRQTGASLNAVMVDGYMHFGILLRYRGEKLSDVRGIDLVKQAVAHFGDSVRGIHASWNSRHTLLAYNLELFNQLTHDGLSVEEAAKQTWTGRVAKELGFAKLEHIDAYERNGQYFSVDVQFGLE